MVVLFTMLLLLACSSSKQVQKKPQKEEYNALSDPARTQAIVSAGVNTLFPELKEKLTRYASIYSLYDTISIKMYINPVGSIDLIGFVQKIETGPGNILQNFLFRQIIDSTLKTETITKAVIHTYKDSNNAIVISDAIDISYIEIRDRDQILMLINLNKDILGKTYSKRWAENPNLEGTITVRFGIDEHGKVVFCKIMKSTMNDSVFEQSVVDIVKKWQFGPINNPGDVTEVVYPFVFSQE